MRTAFTRPVCAGLYACAGTGRRPQETSSRRKTSATTRYVAQASTEQRRVPVVAEQRGQELANVGVLVHDAVRVPQVLDRHQEEAGLLELVDHVGEQARGEDDQEDPVTVKNWRRFNRRDPM